MIQPVVLYILTRHIALMNPLSNENVTMYSLFFEAQHRLNTYQKFVRKRINILDATPRPFYTRYKTIFIWYQFFFMGLVKKAIMLSEIKRHPSRLVWLAAAISLLLFVWRNTGEKIGSGELAGSTIQHVETRISQLAQRPSKLNISHWIVVATAKQPTDELKLLASLAGWSMVVVGGEETPKDWNLPGVHFLSMQDQQYLNFTVAHRLPHSAYTRKNIGYLYAIMNGAHWIYDTGDDIIPYGRGLKQFDYEHLVSGLRYRSVFTNSTIHERLFNPYKFFGNSEMWPRGFPLEHINTRSDDSDRYLLCHEMRMSAVQHGLMYEDADVDDIYQSLPVDTKLGHETGNFNKFAPPILLDEGIYSPFNSQNTLFYKPAFFTLFIPTTAESKSADIWRSYFSQKLLHLVGETVSFYPPNAQKNGTRNRNGPRDVKKQRFIGEQAGAILAFLTDWSCLEKTVEDCTVALARAFHTSKFIGAEDVLLIESWISDLKSINYKFPPLTKNRTSYNEMKEDEKRGNCRKAYLNLKNDLSENITEPNLPRALQKLRDMGELLEWCQKSDENVTQSLSLIPPQNLALRHSSLPSLTHKLNSVLVITNNYPWTRSIGILQRLYEPYFGLIILCGTWTPENYVYDEPVPAMRHSFNYVNISNEEMHRGYFGYYCISKIRDMRLQNVQGYYFVSDDALFNIWHGHDMESVLHPSGACQGCGEFWWIREEGYAAAKRVVDLVEQKYAANERVQRLWKQFSQRLNSNNYADANTHMLTKGKAASDMYYIPTSEMTFLAELSELFIEASFFFELAIAKMLNAITKPVIAKPHVYLWGLKSRRLWPSMYNSSIIMLHPIKFSKFANDTLEYQRFCAIIITTFKEQLFT